MKVVITSVKSSHTQKKSALVLKPRQKFPETWIWDSQISNKQGKIQLANLTVPDTITSWVVTAFSMSPKKGLGLASAQTITAFEKFFVKLNLPYSVKVVLIIIMYIFLITCLEW